MNEKNQAKVAKLEAQLADLNIAIDAEKDDSKKQKMIAKRIKQFRI